MRRQQNLQVNRLEYLEKAMTLYGMYSDKSIEEMVDAINCSYNTISKHEDILSGKQTHWSKNNILERRIAYMVFNSLLYLYELQMKYVNIYKDLISKCYDFISAISAVEWNDNSG